MREREREREREKHTHKFIHSRICTCANIRTRVITQQHPQTHWDTIHTSLQSQRGILPRGIAQAESKRVLDVCSAVSDVPMRPTNPGLQIQMEYRRVTILFVHSRLSCFFREVLAVHGIRPGLLVECDRKAGRRVDRSKQNIGNLSAIGVEIFWRENMWNMCHK